MVTTKYKVGDRVPFHYNPAIIVASYIVSLIGAIATVELLHRRKSGHGWSNWLQLGACSISFGVVGIWCMHFVGNRAIELGDGKKEIQLYYNPVFMALSVFLPVVFLFIGFAFAERFNRTKCSLYLSLGITGIFAGLAIVGMHYIGNFGITTYWLDNDPRHIMGAALIATFACYVAITLFFHQKEHWINSLPRRLPVAAILAIAVTGMHWTAAAGTSYELRQYYMGPENSRNNNTIVAIVLCVVALLLCFFLMWLTSRHRKQLADRAQHVVLASVTFDPDGKLLVTQEGLLPCQKITKKYNHRTFTDEFNVAHSVFQWIFRVTYNWGSVAGLIGTMGEHLRAVDGVKEPSTPASGEQASPMQKLDEGRAPDVDYSIIFREQFCVAASELAMSMGTTIQNLGTLWEDILITSTAATETRTKPIRRPSKVPPVDVEDGLTIPAPALSGRGQLLIVVRKLKKEDCAELITSSFRWATLDQVGDLISRSLQVGRSQLSQTVNRLHDYTMRRDGLLNPGTWLAFFAIRPALKPSTGSWDVLVPKDELYHLPKVNLSDQPPTEFMVSFLSRLDNLSVADCYRLLGSGLKTPKTAQIWTKDEAFFASTLREGIGKLQALVPEQFFPQALFSARPLRDYAAGSPRLATIFAFCIIPDIHIASVRSPYLAYTPLSFFRCQQLIHCSSPDHCVLAHSIHREFNEIRAQQQKENCQKTQEISAIGSMLQANLSRRASVAALIRLKSIKAWLGSASGRSNDNTIQPDDASERELVSMNDMSKQSKEGNRDPGLGGIMVSQAITVHVGQMEDSVMEQKNLGIRSDAAQGCKEERTFADELFETTCARWRRS